MKRTISAAVSQAHSAKSAGCAVPSGGERAKRRRTAKRAGRNRQAEWQPKLSGAQSERPTKRSAAGRAVWRAKLPARVRNAVHETLAAAWPRVTRQAVSDAGLSRSGGEAESVSVRAAGLRVPVSFRCDERLLQLQPGLKRTRS